MPIMQLYPETTAKLKPEVLLDALLDNTGMPQKAIVNDKDYQAIQQSKAQQQQAMMNLQIQQVQADIAAKAGVALKQTIGGAA